MNVVWEVAICDLTKENESERKRLLERLVPRSAKNAEQDCRAMIKYYDMIIEHEYWRLLADTPEQYFLTYFKKPIYWLEQVKQVLLALDNPDPRSQSRAGIEARLAELNQELSAINGEAYRGCWLDTSIANGREYKRLRWFRADGKKGCRILKGEELCQAVKALELLTQIDETTKQLDRVNAILAKLEALDQEKAALLAELAAI